MKKKPMITVNVQPCIPPLQEQNMSGITADKIVDGNTPAAIPLSSLTTKQLQYSKETLDVEIKALSKHVVDLRHATRRLEESKKSLSELGLSADGAEVLLPLTLSVFVPAKLIDTEKVLIDIGTGYCAERTISGAKKHFEDRIQTIGDTCSKALRAIANKRRFAEAIIQQAQERAATTARETENKS